MNVDSTLGIGRKTLEDTLNKRSTLEKIWDIIVNLPYIFVPGFAKREDKSVKIVEV